jgi:hypothetical protein
MDRKINVFGGDGKGTPEDPDAAARQRFVEQMHMLIQGQEGGWYFPTILKQALDREIWKHPRSWHGVPYPPMKLLDFVAAPYPEGLATSVGVIEKLIAGDEVAMLAWDKVVRGEHGGAREGAGRPPTSDPEPPEIKDDNVILEKKPRKGAVVGNSSKQGLRRLDKAAAKGNAKAADL